MKSLILKSSVIFLASFLSYHHANAQKVITPNSKLDSFSYNFKIPENLLDNQGMFQLINPSHEILIKGHEMPIKVPEHKSFIISQKPPNIPFMPMKKVSLVVNSRE